MSPYRHHLFGALFPRVAKDWGYRADVMRQPSLVGTPRCGVRSAQRQNWIVDTRFAGCADPTFVVDALRVFHRNNSGGATWMASETALGIAQALILPPWWLTQTMVIPPRATSTGGLALSRVNLNT